jgi:hypothetical protein
LLALIYLAIRRMFALILLRCRSQEFKELEILVLRHELEILRRQTRRPELRPAAAASRLLPRKRWRAGAMPSYHERRSHPSGDAPCPEQFQSTTARAGRTAPGWRSLP